MCCCPTFIVAGSGPFLAILGAVFTDRFIVQALTDLMPCMEATIYSADRTHRLAKVFTALSSARRSLEEYYMKFLRTEPEPPPNLNRRFFPYPTSFREDATSMTEFEYIAPFRDDSTNITFLAKTTSEPSRKLVVKFVDRYGVGPHELLAHDGMAPRLLFCGSLDGNTHVGSQNFRSGMYLGQVRMVVMDWIDGETADKVERCDWPEDARSQIKNALKNLHDNQFVFGDLRGPNVMFQQNSNKVLLIDFDWSGKVGEVYYPQRLSNGVGWPDGVEDLAGIEVKHDLAMLEKLFTN